MSSEPALIPEDQGPLPWEQQGEAEVFGGDLQDVSLNSLVQLAQAESISGWIRVQRRGEVVLAKGRIVGAVCGALRGIEALRELMFLRDGRYSVVRGQPPDAPLLEGVLYAIMDAYRLREEWSRVSGLVLRRVGDQRWHPIGHPVDRLVAALDGRRSLAELAADLDASVTVVLDPLLDALKIGLLEPAPAPAAAAPTVPMFTPPSLAPVAPPPVAPPPGAAANPPTGPVEPPTGDYYEWIDRARERMRAGDLDAAERALQQALALRPNDRVAQQNLRALAKRRESARG